MSKKHYIVLPKSAIQIDGEIKTPDDQVAHIITDIDLYTLCSSIVYEKFGCEVINDADAESDSDDADGGAEVVAEEVSAESATTTPQTEVEQTEVVENQDEQLDLIAYYMENGLSETIAEALMEATLDESVKDRELLKTMDGIRSWIDKHEDLTDLPKIGKTRSEEIQRVLNS